MAFPYIFFIIANCSSLRIEETGVNGQIQLEDAVTTVCGLQAVPNGVVASSQQADLFVVAFPDIFGIITSESFVFSIIYRINSQVQNDGAVATELGLYHSLIAVQTDVFWSDIEIIAGVAFTKTDVGFQSGGV